jgi:hypothetical protein
MAMHARPVPFCLRLSVTACQGNMNDARGHVGDNRPKRRRREAFLMPLGIANRIPLSKV